MQRREDVRDTPGPLSERLRSFRARQHVTALGHASRLFEETALHNSHLQFFRSVSNPSIDLL